MEAAKNWYSELLGIEPYFERSGPDGRLAYAEFRLGDYAHEPGLIDRRFAPPPTMHNSHYLEVLDSSKKT